MPLENVWDIFSNYLYFIHKAYGVQIHNFVLMSNHFHLLVTTPEANLAEVMNYFMRETSKLISTECGRINQIFGGPYHWSLIKTHHYYLNAYKYVYRNPVEAGLCSIVEQYRFSSLSAKLGTHHTLIPLTADDLLFGDPEKHLIWLNTPYPDIEIKKAIWTALSKKEFQFPKGKDRNSHRLEAQLV